jgi:hypothetical protein
MEDLFLGHPTLIPTEGVADPLRKVRLLKVQVQLPEKSRESDVRVDPVPLVVAVSAGRLADAGARHNVGSLGPGR